MDLAMRLPKGDVVKLCHPKQVNSERMRAPDLDLLAFGRSMGEFWGNLRVLPRRLWDRKSCLEPLKTNQPALLMENRLVLNKKPRTFGLNFWLPCWN